jgi:hypothetical protein
VSKSGTARVLSFDPVILLDHDVQLNVQAEVLFALCVAGKWTAGDVESAMEEPQVG